MGLDHPPPTSANTHGLNFCAKWQAAVPGVDVGCSLFSNCNPRLRAKYENTSKMSALKHEDALWLRRWSVVPPLLFKIARARDISQVIAGDSQWDDRVFECKR
jgi:hypothetical protein